MQVSKLQLYVTVQLPQSAKIGREIPTFSAYQNLSNSEFKGKMEKYATLYKSDGVAKGLSMQTFCPVSGIPYNTFKKYLKLRRNFSTLHKVLVNLFKNSPHCQPY